MFTSEHFELLKPSKLSKLSKHVKQVEQVESVRLLYELVIKIEFKELGRGKGVIGGAEQLEQLEHFKQLE